MDLGSYLEYEGRPAVRFVRRYPHPVSRVWAAVSEPAELASWFPSNVAFEPREGATIHFSGDSYAEDMAGEVLIFDPPHRLSFTWGDNELHLSVVADGEGCQLTLIDVLANRDEAARNGAGWHACLATLQIHLTGSRPSGDPDIGWRQMYERYVAAGLPSGAEVPADL